MTDTEKAPEIVAVPAPKPAPKPAAKAAQKSAAKPITKAASKTAASAPKKVATKTRAAAKSDLLPPVAKPVGKLAETKPPKSKKIKMVRDSLSIPKLEYDVLDTLKLRAAKMGNPVKKTELIRAGIKAVAALSDSAFLTLIQSVPSLKTGRPSKAN